ncbi:MAG: YjbQ family protein [Candidatus Gastranaerophilales bacterium]|nr:YjbQ family protein [Candidatus Gastranaerophilales bacterium]
MTVLTEKFTITTKGFDDVIDITSRVQSIVSNSQEKNAIVNISTTSSTASILTLEYEPGLVVDLPKLLENIVPINKVYQHDNTWHDGNAYAHLRATLLGNNITLSVENGEIILNTWQKIVLIDFDNKQRTRQIVVSVMY